MGDGAGSHSLLVGPQIVADNPLGEDAEQRQGAAAVDHNGFFLQDECIPDGWTFRVETQVDTEAGHHTGEDHLIGSLAGNQLEFDVVYFTSDGGVASVELEPSDSLEDGFD